MNGTARDGPVVGVFRISVVGVSFGGHVRRGLRTCNRTLRDIKTRGIIHVGLGIEIASSFIHAALNRRDPCTFAIGSVRIEHGFFITIITSIANKKAALVVNIGFWTEVTRSFINTTVHRGNSNTITFCTVFV